MEDGLVLARGEDGELVWGLNPCCNGRWSRTSNALNHEES